ncbi:myo-inosose-2 dehydratase [Chryseobacterium lactis]|uniref:Myo-inosose-2 dehydratase n=1 Tax=Chryseobacterium lactis TaxID=1241981 RepID=A0A3G6RHH5_CHRLC|nr:myo-inosose-2 dehydratase [Chryseobacterium lactis]AZA82087.1 myo-inosose-2 dehydratase [Chryseobacterium lactis]AZB02467.1 myo-inosose-2 dehydratase [Chryseobacterium lactis]PNW14237.1 myo-inosose-2 dehydratase [Chryseobacterium lactis]
MIQLGIAPIGWTNDDMPELGKDITFEQCISEMALAGYTGCEVGNKYPEDPSVLKKHLDIRGLTICNQWFSYQLTTQSYEQVKQGFIKQLNFLKHFNSKIVGGAECGNTIHGEYNTAITQRKKASDEDWKKLTNGLNELGKIALNDFGMHLSYHHHMGTMVQTIDETERLLNETKEKYVQLNYDCGHFDFANEDPVEALQKFISRTAHIHFKDVRKNIKEQVYKENLSFLQAVKLGIYTVPGDGNLDMQALAKIIHENQYKGWIVVEAEQDPAKANPFEYAQKGYQFMKDILKF